MNINNSQENILYNFTRQNKNYKKKNKLTKFVYPDFMKMLASRKNSNKNSFKIFHNVTQPNNLWLTFINQLQYDKVTFEIILFEVYTCLFGLRKKVINKNDIISFNEQYENMST